MPAFFNRISQTARSLRARVRNQEKEAIENILGPELSRLFFSLHLADQRHSLDLLSSMANERDLTGEECRVILLHDIGKSEGNIRVFDRIFFVLMGPFRSKFIERPQSRMNRLARSLWVLYNHPKLGREIIGKFTDDERLLFLIENHHNQSIKDDFLLLLQEYDGK